MNANEPESLNHLFQRYGIVIRKVIDDTTLIVQCQRCRGTGYNPRVITEWMITTSATDPCWLCQSLGIVTLHCAALLLPHAYCQATGYAQATWTGEHGNVQPCRPCMRTGFVTPTGAPEVIRKK